MCRGGLNKRAIVQRVERDDALQLSGQLQRVAYSCVATEPSISLTDNSGRWDWSDDAEQIGMTHGVVTHEMEQASNLIP